MNCYITRVVIDKHFRSAELRVRIYDLLFDMSWLSIESYELRDAWNLHRMSNMTTWSLSRCVSRQSSKNLILLNSWTSKVWQLIQSIDSFLYGIHLLGTYSINAISLRTVVRTQKCVLNNDTSSTSPTFTASLIPIFHYSRQDIIPSLTCWTIDTWVLHQTPDCVINA